MNLMEIGRQAVDALLYKAAPPPVALAPTFVYRASAGRVAHEK
jgi:hypothetical protein